MSIRLKLTGVVLGLVMLQLLVVGASWFVLSGQKADGLQINLAGRQRMLSQRMTKEILEWKVARGEEEISAKRKALAGTIDLFNRTLLALRDGGETLDGKMQLCVIPAARDEGTIAALDEGKAMWQPIYMALAKVSSGEVEAESAEGAAAIRLIREHNVALLKVMNKATGAFQKASEAKQSLLTVIQGVALISALILAGIAYWIVVSGVVKPIGKVVEKIRDIASGSGDLSQRADEERSDEMGALAKEFNVLAEKFQHVVAAVNKATKEVGDIADEIEESSEEMIAGMGRQNQQIGQINSAMDEMAVAVMEVAQKSGQASEYANVSGDYATEGAKAVSQTIEDMQTIANVVMSGAGDVGELGKRSEQIGEIIKTINEIAEQTNLLALNAAIEAARAGSHGRGFAVVADEVRKLADRTTKATDEIAQSIITIQNQTKGAVAQMNEGSEHVQEGVEKAEKAGENLQMIVQSTHEVAGMIQSIAAASEEQSASSEEVGRSVRMITEASQETAEGANMTVRRVHELSMKANVLRETIDRFGLREGEMESVANQAIDDVA